MGNMARFYGAAVRDEIELFAAWPIGTQLRLGDIGFLTKEGKLFERWRNLSDLGIRFASLKAKSLTDFDFTIGKQVAVRFKAAGDAPLPGCMLADAEVGVSIAFGRSSSILVVAHTKEESIKDLQELETDLIGIASDKSKKWKRDYVVVTAAYESVGTTVILSSGRSSTLDIKANAGVSTPFDLADAQIGLGASTRCQKLLKALARPGFVPFIRVHHLIKGRGEDGPRLSRFGS